MNLLTEKAMAASLLKLLEKKSLDKITIKDITDDCSVNRQTFYYHFHDIYDLLEWIVVQETSEILKDGITADNWKICIKKTFEQLMENKVVFMNVFEALDRQRAESVLQDILREPMISMTEDFAKDRFISHEDVIFLANILIFATSGVIMEWIAGGLGQEFIDNNERFYMIMDGTIESALNKLEELHKSKQPNK